MEDHREDFILLADKRQYGKLDLKGRARAMRHQPTAAEEALWQALRGGRVGAKFRRQHAIDRYIVDLVCIGKWLVVEADGAGHRTPDQTSYDQGRSELLAERGFRVLRFPNARILHDLPGVLAEIETALTDASPPSPQPFGEGRLTPQPPLLRERGS